MEAQQSASKKQQESWQSGSTFISDSESKSQLIQQYPSTSGKLPTEAESLQTQQQVVASASQKRPAQLRQTQAGGTVCKAKITHRSQSSPSSLTTHKFGLRPTPSPPRLIIDHQTGDIVETYPENPVYYRTYQPLDDYDDPDCNDDVVEDIDASEATDCFGPLSRPLVPLSGPNSGYNFGDGPDVLEQAYLPIDRSQLSSLSSHQRRQPYGSYAQPEVIQPSLLDYQQHQIGIDRPEAIQAGDYLSYEDIMSRQQDQQQQFSQQSSYPSQSHQQAPSSTAYRAPQYIPPPHSAKSRAMYAAAPSNSNQFVGDSFNMSQAGEGQQVRAYMDSSTPGNMPFHSGAHNSSFKRALNKLNNSPPAAKTDIAIVTDAESGKLDPFNGERLRLISQSAQSTKNNSIQGKSRQLQAQRPQQQHLLKHRQMLQDELNPLPNIEDFKLYDGCYLFRLILAVLLSTSIIYLLIVPLSTDCTLHRPTYTYISIICASVNLICIIIFTLFWYCNSVTRTLYANLSSSAFIITIYSILVGINLALAIVLFFVNNCYYQRLINTAKTSGPLPLVVSSSLSSLDENIKFNRLVSPSQIESRGRSIIETLEESQAGDHRSYRENENKDEPDQATGIEFEQNYSKSMTDVEKRQILSQGIIDDLETTMASMRAKPQHLKHRNKRRSGEADESSMSSHHNHNGHQLLGSLVQTGDQFGHTVSEQSTSYDTSPHEAVWEYLKEQATNFRRSFYQFLYRYDLKFIGALHALCAICLQYMAMRVAVVRSYFCSPVRTYI